MRSSTINEELDRRQNLNLRRPHGYLILDLEPTTHDDHDLK